MGWKGTVRSIKADMRKADRAAQKRQKERQKIRETNDALQAIDEWRRYIKLSKTNMPKGQLNEIYQDYICSVVLKTAGDIFQLLPFDSVKVVCRVMMLNKSNGHEELTPILSANIERSIFQNLNLDKVDSSDCMKNFEHLCKFKKTTGYTRIEVK